MSEAKLVDFRLKHMGFIFQAFNLFPEMTALENAAFALNCKGMKQSERNNIARQALTEMGLKPYLSHRPDELSGGQQQRVAIVRAIASRPEIVFADEPTGNLDTKTSSQVIKRLRGLVKANGSTLLMVTHDMEKARFADRIILIEDGMVV
jgi:putative ABC transport system ATP-binding protein